MTQPGSESLPPPVATGTQRRAQIVPLGLAVTMIGLGTVIMAQQEARQAALFAVGILLGITLYHTAFGFASTYRRLFLRRQVSGMMAQLLMLAVATLLFAPVLSSGTVFGRGVVGAIAPAGWQVATGAFMFGLGMQLGGGCGSGTLFGLGGGNTRLVVTLMTFVTGSFWASLHMGWWQSLPSLGALALGWEIGWPLAVICQLGLLALAAVALKAWGNPDPQVPTRVSTVGWRVLLQGPWPLAVGALILAILNFSTLLLAGHPWSITWGFTLWGAKTATLLGWDPSSSPFWTGGFQKAALENGIWHDVTSVMNIGILLGALCAAALAGRFKPGPIPAARPLAAAVVGGLAMGYGARIGFGCNIGAFFSGVASTSLHGWLWIALALPGCWLGVRLRPMFGLPN